MSENWFLIIREFCKVHEISIMHNQLIIIIVSVAGRSLLEIYLHLLRLETDLVLRAVTNAANLRILVTTD